jgi:hypothetical protein
MTILHIAIFYLASCNQCLDKNNASFFRYCYRVTFFIDCIRRKMQVWKTLYLVLIRFYYFVKSIFKQNIVFPTLAFYVCNYNIVNIISSL